MIDPDHRAESALVGQLAVGGNFINLYRTMAHSMPALERFYALATSLWGGGLTRRTIERAANASTQADVEELTANLELPMK
jgi:hypothetical protein